MAKYISGKVKDLNVGISNYSENKTSVTVIGNVGIGTLVPTDQVGSGNTAVLAAGIVSAYEFYGDGSNLTNVGGGSTSQILADNLDVVGITTLRGTLSVGGVSTFSSAIDANGDLDVDGHTELDDVNIAGVATANNFVGISGSLTNFIVTGIGTFSDNVKLNFGGSNDLQIYHATSGGASTSYIDNNTGPLYIRNNVDDDDGGNIIIEAKSGKASAVFQDDEGVRLYFNDAEKFATLSTGATVTGDLYATTFYGDGSDLVGVVTNTGIDTTGTSDFSTLNVSTLLDVDGHTELDDVKVTGVSTFENDIRITGVTTFYNTLDSAGSTQGSVVMHGGLGVSKQVNFGDGLNVIGHTELDNINVSGIATLGGTLSVAGVSTFTGVSTFVGIATFQSVDINNGTIDGTNIGVSHRSNANFNYVDIANDLDVTGHTDLADVNVSGVSTLTGNTFVGSAITMYASSGIVSATSFYGDGSNLSNITADSVGDLASLRVTGISTLDGTLSVGGVSTFTDDINANGNIIGDGSTNISGIASLTLSSKIAHTGDTHTSLAFGTGIISLVADGGTAVGNTRLSVLGDMTQINDYLLVSGNAKVTGVTTFNGDVSIGGTLTYEDVTNVDSIGLITARDGLHVTGGVSTFVGVVTTSSDLYVGQKLSVAGVATFNNQVLIDGTNILNIGNGNAAIYRPTNGGPLRIDVAGNKDLYLRTNAGGTTGGNIHLQPIPDEEGVVVNSDGSVELYHDNAKKFETTSTGSIVTGVLTATTYYGDGSNLTGVNTTGAAGGWNPDSQYNLYAGTGTGTDSDADTCCNVAIGYSAGHSNCAGDKNVFLGACAGSNIKAGGCNVYLGAYAGKGTTGQTTGGAENIAIGLGAACCIGDSSFMNILIGDWAGSKLVSGTKNIIMGNCAGACCAITGSGNLYLGSLAGRCTTTGSDNIALGRNSLGEAEFSGSDNIVLGQNAAKAITSSSNLIAIGEDALTTEDANGSGVIAIGLEALKIQNASTNVGGTIGKNIAIGEKAGLNLVDATENIFLGYYAGSGVLGSKNIAIGSKTLNASTSGQLNVAIGLDAAKANTGSSNVVIGGNAAAGGAGDGSENVFLGQYSGYNISDGDKNTFLGRGTGNTVTTGCCNVLIGYNVDAVAASDKTFKIGIAADTWISGDSSYNTTLAGIVTAYASGIVSATSYYGDGSNLTGTGGGTLISGITVQEESSTVGTAGSITILDFQGASVTAAASGSNKAVITVAGAASTDAWIADSQENLVAGNGAGAARDADTCFNIMLGCNSGASLNAGDQNVYLGCEAGRCTTAGVNNIAIGDRAGKCAQGGCNITMGIQAGYNFSSGSSNIAFGSWAMSSGVVTGSQNVAIGMCAGQNISSGASNLFMGQCSGMYSTTAKCNVFLGYIAGKCRQFGNHNIGIGNSALRGTSTPSNNSGSNNIALGHGAGCKVKTGADNIALGRLSLGNGDVTGSANVTLGHESGYNLISANYNVFFGNYAGRNTTTGSKNIAIGADAMFNGTVTGSENIAIGALAGKILSSGSYNILIGCKSGCRVTSGSGNIAIGHNLELPSATDNNQLGIGSATNYWIFGDSNFNVGIGTTNFDAAVGSGVTSKAYVGILSAYQLYGDGQYLTNVGGASTDAWAADSQENLFAGTSAGAARDADTCYNIGIGYSAGAALNAGDDNILLGCFAGNGITSGQRNIAIGKCALGAGTLTGQCNIGIGYMAGADVTSGNWNIFLGMYTAEKFTTGKYNIAFGINALRKKAVSGCSNIILGRNAACCLQTGDCNVYLGAYAASRQTTNGNHNVAIGSKAGEKLSSGACNVLLGYQAGNGLSTGYNNVFIGKHDNCNTNIYGADNIAIGKNAGCSITGGCYNIFFGMKAGNTNTTGCYNIAIGCDVELPSATGSDQLAIGRGTNHWITGDSDFNVGIGTNTTDAVGVAVTAKLSVGIVSAYMLYGCGANITGIDAGFSPDSQENLYAGTGAGANSNADSCYNVGIGYSALHNYASNNTFDGCNVAIGKEAGYTVTGTNTGLRNIYIGDKAGYGHDSNNSIFIGTYTAKAGGGSENVVIGGFAGCAMQAVAAQRLVIIGQCAGKNQCNAGDNTFLGHSAGRYNKTGGFNVFVGAYAGDGCSNNSAAQNVAIGFNAANCISTGSQNTIMGNLASAKITTGIGNVAIGAHAGCETTTAGYNVYLGDSAGRNMQTGDYNFAGGYAALKGSGTAADNSGDYNVAIGNKAGNVITSGASNVLIGCKAGDALTSGSNHVAIGVDALSAEDTLSGSIAIGYEALKLQNNGNGNTAIGCGAGTAVVTGGENVFLGWSAGANITGSTNTIIGALAMSSASSGSSNVAIGQDAGRNNTGDNNVIIGATAGDASGAGEQNVFVGRNAGSAVTDGQQNTFLGMNAGNSTTTGNGNVMIGSGVCLANGNCSFAIGKGTSYWIQGDSSFNTTVNDISASNFNSTSDIRLKTNIQPIGDPIGKVKQIEGVSFNWKKDNKPALGVIADQVEKILPELVHGDDPKTVNYNGLIGLLIETVKEQQNQIDELNDRISKLE